MSVIQDALLELQFTELADAKCTVVDVAMGYRIFLGRDPENTAVVDEAMTTQVRDFIPGVVTSEEFFEEVLARLGESQPLPHESSSSAPSSAQKDWLLGHLLMPPRSEMVLRAANDWKEWLSILVAMPGFPVMPPTHPIGFKPIDKKRRKPKRSL